MKKKAVVIHSGGLDSSLCLALAAREFGPHNVLSISFCYGQRNEPELAQADKICKTWDIDHTLLNIDCLEKITKSALIGHSIPMKHAEGQSANTLVTGRNGLMVRLGAIHAKHLGAHYLYTGIIEVDGKKNGYRDCTRAYMDLKQEILRQDLADPTFEIRTPLVFMTKKETLELSYSLGILPFLLQESISCYEGKKLQGCGQCFSCEIRNNAIAEFLSEHKEFPTPF